MPRRASFLFVAFLLTIAGTAQAAPRASRLPPAAPGVIDFARDVQPILGTKQADAVEAGAWVALARTLLNLDEFVTRE